MNKPRSFFLVFIIILVVLFTAARPYAVFAEDETPPTSDSAEPVDPEQTPPTEDSTTTSDEETISPAEILEQLPEGTDLVVLDEAGEAIPLVTEQAAEIVVTGDPLWCPDGQTPTPGLNGCSPGFTSMSDLITYLTSNEPAAAGTIWIEDSYDSSVNDPAATDFTIDGSAFTTWSNYALIIQGGWNGAHGDSTITGTSEFNAPLLISNWGSNVTLNDLIFFNTGGAEGLHVDTTGNVSLDNVEANSNSGGAGANIDTSGGAGNVTVNDSRFNDNADDGLFVNSGGDVTLTDVYANRNSADGADISTSDSTVSVSGGTFNSNGDNGIYVDSGDGDINIQELDAQNNYHSGLSLHLEDGTVDVSDGVFNSNGTDFTDGGYGIYVDNCNYDSFLDTCTTSGGVTLANLIVLNNSLDGASIASGGDVDVSNSVFTDQYQDGYGLYISDAVNVIITDVLADWNSYGGAYIDADNDVTVTGGVFNNNDGTVANGLEIRAGGNIFLTDVEASGNQEYGVYAPLGVNMDVDGGVFNNNGETGLYATTDGSISVNDVQASGNGESGADISNAGGDDILVTDSEFNYNNINGLIISSNGNVSLDGVTASDNDTGVYINNNSGTGSVGISNGEFNSNNFSGGLLVISNGALTITDIIANFNAGGGAYFNNSGGSEDVTINSSAFNANEAAGFQVDTAGNLSLNNVSAGANVGYGGLLDAAGNITDVSSSNNSFNNNGTMGIDCFGGIQVNSGTATLDDCYDDDTNVWFTVGASTYRWLGTTGDCLLYPGDICVDGTSDPIFDALDEIETNLYIPDGGILHIEGALTPYLEDIELDGGAIGQVTQIDGGGSDSTLIAGFMEFDDYASGFSVDGLTFSQYIEAHDNAGALSLSDIGVAGLSVSSSNSAGIDVYDHDGSITLDGVNASGIDTGTGAWLNNLGSSSNDAITVNDGRFSGNSSYGLVAYSYGTITLADVTAGFNVNAGASLDNCIWDGTACDGSGEVDVDSSEFDHNSNDNGLWVNSSGDITLAQVLARGNDSSGAILNANGSLGIVTVNESVFSYNLNSSGSLNASGLEAYIYGDGYFSLDEVTANANGGGGAYLEHSGTNSSSEANVSVIDGQFNYQYDGYGLWIFNEADGDIHLENVTADGNWLSSASLINEGSTGNTTVLGGDFNFSQTESGLEVYNDAEGDIYVSDLTANSNYFRGAYLSNDLDGDGGTLGPDGTLTLIGSTTGNNVTSNGLIIQNYNNGAITLTDVIANANGGLMGASVFNYGMDHAVSVDPSIFNNNAGIGLDIVSAGAISLADITALNNGGTGVQLDNTTGTDGVSIGGTNDFSHNGGDGLYISSNGEISLANITASANQGYGANICNCNSGVTISGANIFNGNSFSGLYISTAGAISGGSITAGSNGSYGIEAYAYDDITLNDLTASNNVATGALLDNTSGTGFIEITGMNIFNANGNGSGDRGLHAASNSDITVDDVTAGADEFTGNSGAGVYLDNSSAGAVGDITINGGLMGYNGTEGVYILSAGEVSLYDVYADNNDEMGAFIENDFNTGYLVTVDTGSFSNNLTYDGLQILSAGNVFITDIFANGNAVDGAFIDNDAGTGTVDVHSSEFDDNISGHGLNIETNGAITGSDIDANDNGLSGALLHNHLAASAEDVTLTGTNTFNGNGDTGLDVRSQGVVTLNDITARNNTGANGLYVDNKFSTIAANVTLTGTNAFTGNQGTNLAIWSHGAISLNNITAEDSVTGDGAYLDNLNSPPTPGDTSDDVPVMITGTNSFTNNYLNGLFVFSEGVISVEGVTADENQIGKGAYLDNTNGSGNIHVDGTQFNSNTGDGLHVLSMGMVTLANLAASSNSGNGAYVDNCRLNAGLCLGTGVVVVGQGTFNQNVEDGLEVTSNGDITLTDVIANLNDDRGAWLVNRGGDVSVSDSNFDNNTDGQTESGLIISSPATAVVTLDNISVSNNHDGAAIYGFSTLTVQNSVFNDNYSTTNSFGWGLFAPGFGNITLIDVTASGNGGPLTNIFTGGAYLSSQTGNISIDPSTFNNNENGYGLYLNAGGDILLSEVTANGNDRDGAYLDANGNADVLCSQFNNNGNYGVDGSNVTGTLTFEDVTLTGNSTGPFSGSPAITSGPCAVPGGGGGGSSSPSVPGPALIPVTGGKAALDCALFGGTTLMLPNGDSLTFLCPTRGDASASTLADDGLPGDLPEGTTFAAGIDGGLTNGDSEPLPGKVIISFVIPDDVAADQLAILYWNGSEWVDLKEASFDDGRSVFDSGHNTDDGHFEASTNFTGTFVLVSK